MQKSVFHFENDINNSDILRTESYERLQIHHVLSVEMPQKAFSVAIYNFFMCKPLSCCLETVKLTDNASGYLKFDERNFFL